MEHLRSQPLKAHTNNTPNTIKATESDTDWVDLLNQAYSPQDLTSLN